MGGWWGEENGEDPICRMDSLIDSVSCRRRSNNIERFQTFSGEHTCMLAHHWTPSAHLKYKNTERISFLASHKISNELASSAKGPDIKEGTGIISAHFLLGII